MSKHPHNKTIRPRRVTPMPVPVQHAPATPSVHRKVSHKRLKTVIDRLRAGWQLISGPTGYRLVLKNRSEKVRTDVVLAIARLFARAKGRTVTA